LVTIKASRSMRYLDRAFKLWRSLQSSISLCSFNLPMIEVAISRNQFCLILGMGSAELSAVRSVHALQHFINRGSNSLL